MLRQAILQSMQHSISKALVATMSKTTLPKAGPAKLATKLPLGVQKPVRTSTAFETRLYDVRCTVFPCSPLIVAASRSWSAMYGRSHACRPACLAKQLDRTWELH